MKAAPSSLDLLMICALPNYYRNTDPTKRPTFDKVVEMLHTTSECIVQAEGNGL